MADEGEDARRCTVVSDYWRKRLNLRDLRDGTAWENLNNAKDSAETKDNLKPLQSGGEMTGEVICPYGNEHGSSILATEARPRDRSWAEMTDGEIIGEVLGPFDNEHFIVEASCGSRYYCRSNLDKEKITCGSRVVVDMTTSTIMRTAPLPEEVDPVVVVRDQMRQLRELVELPLRHPDLLRSLGIKPPGEKLLPPSCLEKSSPADCPRSIAARNGHTERCPRATTAQKEIVDCSGKDRKRIGVVVFSRIKVVPRITCKLSKKK